MNQYVHVLFIFLQIDFFLSINWSMRMICTIIIE